MAGVYIHIPFCRRACHYCNFHFSTNRKIKSELVKALLLEIENRANYLNTSSSLQKTKLQSIYFGGGTPSLLSADELDVIFEKLNEYFDFDSTAEITLEANPDDLTIEKLSELKQSPINRLSIGIQSFFDDDLKLMNRAHNATEALKCVKDASASGFENITIDLMYALPTLTNEKWKQNLETAFALPINHLSCYNLTIEEGTALQKMIAKNKTTGVDDNLASAQFEMLMNMVSENNFEQYEISNFARNKNYAVHNSNYWKGEKYLGIGPSAHSFNGTSRQWNVADNNKYVEAVNSNSVYFEQEILNEKIRYNEFILTRLRTIWGINEKELNKLFSITVLSHFQKSIQPFLENKWIEKNNDTFTLTRSGIFFADKISSDLFQ